MNSEPQRTHQNAVLADFLIGIVKIYKLKFSPVKCFQLFKLKILMYGLIITLCLPLIYNIKSNSISIISEINDLSFRLKPIEYH